ncbi:MAG TPA: tetratricopeptide repeat protein [Terriglobales bacterium]|nr:tetratricopeptide repeat protein [Terriglobales bacterium]
MLSRKRAIVAFFLLAGILPAYPQNSEQVQVGPPPIRRAEPPSAGATAEELEKRGDELRADKNFLDAIDYYEAAFKKSSGNAAMFNKMGICNLQLQRYKEARKSFERAIKIDRNHADAYNNLGVVYYEVHDYGRAIRRYEKAISLNPDAASYYSNLGAAQFSKKQFDKAAQNYGKALALDPDIFERISRAGVQAQLPSPDDRARYDYVLAKLYAKMGINDRSLRYLRKAMEEGYKDIGNVYKDSEFAELRKDPRFAELMSTKPLGIPE